jgi:AraC-like DNA-binding protein
MEKLCISTSAFSANDRTEAFREDFGRAILRIDIEPYKGKTFECEMKLQHMPGLAMASGFASPMHCRHTADLIDNDDLVLVFIEGNDATLEQHGRMTEIPAGRVVLTANGEPAAMASPKRTNLVNLRLSRERLAPHLANIGHLFHAPLLRDGPALRLLKSYMQMLNHDAELKDACLEQTIATHLYDLTALALGATPDAAVQAKMRGVRAARLQAIKTDILDGLTRSDLTVDMMAGRHKISTSYIRQLFADEGATFRDYVLDQRLARAYRILTSPQRDWLTISQIAFDCGFSDLSYFNRRFRQRYGATPSDIRTNCVRKI